MEHRETLQPVAAGQPRSVPVTIDLTFSQRPGYEVLKPPTIVGEDSRRLSLYLQIVAKYDREMRNVAIQFAVFVSDVTGRVATILER